jgi:hypothetical protein
MEFPVNSNERGLTMMKRIFLYTSIFLLLASTSHAVLIFEETFSKDQSGPVEIHRTIPGLPGAALVVFSNGGIENPQVSDMVGLGSIEINGDTIFGSQEFKILGSITRKIPLIDGPNNLIVSMKGKSGGKLTLQVFQGGDQPSVTFPPGTIFVSPLGTNTPSCGIKRLPPSNPADTSGPCLTINYGLNRAQQTSAPQVAVGLGIYLENITLRSGIPLMGGYDAEFSRRDLVSLRSIIKGDGSLPATVSANSIVANTLFEGFIVEGPSVIPSTPTTNSIGLYIKDCTAALVIKNNIIFGGVAADGAQGSNGASGQSGPLGSNGQNGVSYSLAHPPPASLPGGLGGSSPNAGGGNGGISIPPVANSQQASGQSGFGNMAGLGGSGGYNWQWDALCSVIITPGPMDGNSGLAGGSGIYGIGGIGGQNGVLLNGIWVSSTGADGVSGASGKGGGGGGAAGGVVRNNCTTGLVGSSGGGGGAGGAGASGGSGGQGGGSAFGIFVVSSASQIPEITSNQIHLGIAGNGGNGGFGGKGGEGGQGGLGGTATYSGFLANVAGSGGRGGDGGHGGGGGGGAGGISVGIFANLAAQYENLNTIDTSTGRSGFGGNGGLSYGNPGEGGLDGEVSATFYLP